MATEEIADEIETNEMREPLTSDGAPQETVVVSKKPSERTSNSYKSLLLYFSIYLSGISTLLLIIADPFTMGTYFSDKSLLTGLVNREFSLKIEAEYYLKDLEKLTQKQAGSSLGSNSQVVRFLERELDGFGLEVYNQNFHFNTTVTTKEKGVPPYQIQLNNGTNVYSIIRGERSTSSEAVLLCAPYKMEENANTLSSVALSLALAKYFSTKSYWAKDIIILFSDYNHFGVSAWLDSYHDVTFKSRFQEYARKDYYESLADRSGPMQAAIVLEMYSREFTRMNVKIQGSYGQLPNLDLFNLVIELAARESVTPYFHDKTIPYGLTTEELFKHHLETAISFIKTQATMQSDGIHGLFLRYAVQSLTLECPEYTKSRQSQLISASLLNAGRLVEGIFRSLNNLTERFNRSYYFYIIVSLRRFTSIGYYMIGFGLLVSPVFLKAFRIYSEDIRLNRIDPCSRRARISILFALSLCVLSTLNISTALVLSVILVPLVIFCYL